MREFYEILADRIANDPDLTDAGLANAAGLDNSTIRQMIRHKRSPRINTAIKICKALGTTVEDFLSESHDPVRAELRLLLSQLEDHELLIIRGALIGIVSQRS